MGKKQNDNQNQINNIMLKEKTNQDYNKQIPNPNDPNQKNENNEDDLENANNINKGITGENEEEMKSDKSREVKSNSVLTENKNRKNNIKKVRS